MSSAKFELWTFGAVVLTGMQVKFSAKILIQGAVYDKVQRVETSFNKLHET